MPGLAIGLGVEKASDKEGDDGRKRADKLREKASKERERLFTEAREDAAGRVMKAVKSGNTKAFREALDEYMELRF